MHAIHWFVAVCTIVNATACSNPDEERTRKTTQPTYDRITGKLTELTYDRNQNGVIDTWADMDGSLLLRSRSDMNEDGSLDRWEYYDDKGALTKVGYSRRQDGRVDAWAFSGADGQVNRVEVSSTANEKAIDRWEHYVSGAIARAEADTNGDGRPDTWQSYEAGSLKAASMDQDGDGRPDRRLTYSQDVLVLIETNPDEAGIFRESVRVR